MIKGPFSQSFLPLGFGCARLFGDRHTGHSLQLLETAYDAGIRYFDVARMYAWGGAEEVLGIFQSRHRGDIVITSKAGILPLAGGSKARWLLEAATRAADLVNVRIPSRLMFRFGGFDPRTLRESVETSLRALRMDCLDALLLHEVDEADLADGTVMALLEDLRTVGTIKTYGIASIRAQTLRLVNRYAEQIPIVQTANTVLADGLAPLADRGRFFTITHSVLAEALEKIMRYVAAEMQRRREWISTTDIDPTNRDAMAGLLLAEALDANQGGCVLFSSASPGRIAAAAHVAHERPYTQEQIIALRQVAAQVETPL